MGRVLAGFQAGALALGGSIGGFVSQLLQGVQRQQQVLFQQLNGFQNAVQDFFENPLPFYRSQVLGFFFGRKDHRIEEQKNREGDDFAHPEHDFVKTRRVEGAFA
ncbi:MAG: hypothetical protein R2857_07410 [Vampirovibrionales bacterium]